IRPALALLVGWWLAEIVRAGAPAGRLVPALRGLALATAGVALGGVVLVAALAAGWLPGTAVERLLPAAGPRARARPVHGVPRAEAGGARRQPGRRARRARRHAGAGP